ncbi:SAC3/GANP domain protein [Lineolata rhizophorae]|uniref:SAC3/GANP domain protein n=1 Tax=Lineolata rhizophorae TaxID=578093 RepID=A0A6A6NM84_9PEZI|nr:SAC3/GANP domain protein [Lineolata rhizophorae]
MTTSQTTSQPAPAPRKVEWPQSVREYVQRCFAPGSAIPGIDHVEMEAMLKKIITQAAESDRLLEIDWDKHPLPQQIIQAERKAAQGRASTPPLRSQPFYEGSHSYNSAAAGTANMPTSKKRKSADSDALDQNGDLPPWRKNTRNLEDRVSYAQNDRTEKRQRKKAADDATTRGTSKYQSTNTLEKRKQRFGDLADDRSPHMKEPSPTDSASDGPVVGMCQTLEKKYFRLTSAPKPETVRPLPVLEKTLELLKKKWRKESNYSYICDQFKSLRQDLTVQHIKNEFTVNVYEIHARIALEKGDMGEYNQCQTQLRALYSQNLGGHPAEFVAYRILYCIYTRNRTGMNEVLADLTTTDKTKPPVKHALAVRSALALGNYHKFFRLYLDTPNMGAYLLDSFIGRERLAALANISKAYKPDVKIRFLTEELGFESDQDCVQFLCDHGAEDLIEPKEDSIVLVTGKVGRLFEDAKTGAFRKVDIKGQI